jgi:hypothetical protein
MQGGFFPGVNSGQIWRAGLHNDESGGGQLRGIFRRGAAVSYAWSF